MNPTTDLRQYSETALAAARQLRRFSACLLRADDDRLEPSRFILDDGTGDPILCVSRGFASEELLTLHAPDDTFENPDAVHLNGSVVSLFPEKSRADDAARDKWLMAFASHSTGNTDDATRSVFIRLEVDSLKTEAAGRVSVLDGPEARIANPLLPSLGTLCKRANADPTALAAFVLRETGTQPESGRAVSFDPWGMHIRATFGLIRIEYPLALTTEAEVTAYLDARLSDTRTSGRD